MKDQRVWREREIERSSREASSRDNGGWHPEVALVAATASGEVTTSFGGVCGGSWHLERLGAAVVAIVTMLQ